MILLDMHVLVWTEEGDRRLGETARATIEETRRVDRAVLNACGWTNTATDCDFLPRLRVRRGHLGQEEEAVLLPMTTGPRVRDEVLAHPLAFNAEHTVEEARSGTTSSASHRRRRQSLDVHDTDRHPLQPPLMVLKSKPSGPPPMTVQPTNGHKPPVEDDLSTGPVPSKAARRVHSTRCVGEKARRRR